MADLLRRATLADVDSLVELRALMFAEMGVASDGVGWAGSARGWFARAVDDPAVCLVVVERDGELLSCGLAELRLGAPGPTCPTGVTAQLSNLVTRPGSRGRGLAGRCLAELLEWSGEHADRAELHASGQGIGLYRSWGFVETTNPAMRLDLRPRG